MAESVQSELTTEHEPVAYKPWTPQPGPQLAAIEADWCYEILYGGARGGGKSIYLLLDFLKDVKKYGDAWHGILVRKTYPELDQIIADSWRIFAGTGAIYHKQPKTWYWPNGASLKFRNLATPEDCQAYQGHCVAKGTKILMADGSGLEIEKIAVGDMVQTLSGPRCVTHTIGQQIKPCVSAITPYGTQEHPLDHAILTASGWQSAASLWGICSKELASTNPEFYKLRPLSVSARCSTHRPLDFFSQRSYASILFANLYKWKQWCFDNTRIALPLGLKKSLDWAHQFLAALLVSYQRKMCHSQQNVPSCAQTVSCTTSDSQFYYQAYPHLHDELSLVLKGTDLGLFPLLGDVEEPSREHYRLDVRGNTLGYILFSREYEYSHPYSGQALEGILESAFGPCEITFVGDKAVYDLTVDEVNHYISYDTGLVNKNSYQWLGMDELGNYSDPSVYQMMLATVRSGYKQTSTRVRCTANPGGPGHHWIKSRFIDKHPLGFTPFKDNAESKRERMYIPSRITDNKILLNNDKNYIENLKSQASPELVRAWLEGDWDVQLSSFYPDFDKSKHVIRPFLIPSHWYRYRSFDWGHADPFACLFIAVADGSAVVCDDGRTIKPAKGALIVYREVYGMEPNRPNVGVRWTNEQMADAILKATGNDKIGFTTTDSLPFQNRGGPTIAEIMHRRGLRMQFGNTDRITGWAQIHSRLAGNEQGGLLYIFDECVHLIRTLPQLQHDKHKMEDVADGYEDHLCLSGDTKVLTDKGLIKIEEITDPCVIYDQNNNQKQATRAVMTRRKATVVRLILSNLQQIICTPDHRFLLADRTWERADQVLGKQLYVTPKSSQKPNSSLEEKFSTSIKGKGILARGALDCTGWFGRLITGKFLLGIMSTIKTAIHRIIVLRIWNYFQRNSITKGILEYLKPLQTQRLDALLCKEQQSGISQKKEDVGQKSTMKMLGISCTRSLKSNVFNALKTLKRYVLESFVPQSVSNVMHGSTILRKRHALSVIKNMLQPNIVRLKPVVQSVDLNCNQEEAVLCVLIERLEETADVFCLNVPDVGHFQIEGGIVSKNCDALRLACMERPIIRKPISETPFDNRLTFDQLIKRDEWETDDD